MASRLLASTARSPITSGFRCRRRSGWCGSGRSSRTLDLKLGSVSAKDQKTRSSILPLGLDVVTGLQKAGPGLTPIVGAFRGPFEFMRTQQTLQRPGGIVGDVGSEAEFAARPQYAGEPHQHFVLNEAAFPVPAFRPWVRMDQVDPRQRMLRKPADEICGIVEMQADVAQVFAFDSGEPLGHAVDERLDADEALVGLALRLRRQVFAAAESD